MSTRTWSYGGKYNANLLHRHVFKTQFIITVKNNNRPFSRVFCRGTVPTHYSRPNSTGKL